MIAYIGLSRQQYYSNFLQPKFHFNKHLSILQSEIRSKFQLTVIRSNKTQNFLTSTQTQIHAIKTTDMGDPIKHKS